MITKSQILNWYKKDWVIEELVEDCTDREVMAVTLDNKVKRPVNLYSGGDIEAYVSDGAISFHRTVEKFSDLQNFQNVLSYDIIFDIDFKSADVPFLDKLKTTVEFALKIVDFLYQFGFKEDEVGIKYSGNTGIHIRLSLDGLDEDEKVYGIPVKTTFPLFARYVVEFIQSLSTYLKMEMSRAYLTKFVDIDLQVASKRHMIRAVCSINEKLPGVSVPLSYEELGRLPDEYIKYKFPNALKLDKTEGIWSKTKTSNKILDLIRIATFWAMLNEAANRRLLKESSNMIKVRKKFKKITNLTPEVEKEQLFPPCIRNILAGLEDGRKRAIFILINFLKNIGWDWDAITREIVDWNPRNKEPIRDSYIEYQLKWHKEKYQKGEKYLPPSCNNETYYKDMVSVNGPVCTPDELCPLIRNPLSYYYRKLRAMLPKEYKDIKKEEQTRETTSNIPPEDLL